jgi:[CysO sulfur-carrier protein]-S-L-cysteine hydrolase
MLNIPEEIINRLFKIAANGLPEEICGYLAGKGIEVTRVFELENADHSPEHFSFFPADQFEAVRQARKAGLEILANYHSHPETPARLSQEDIRLAFDPDISYVIISLAGENPDIKSFRVTDGIAEKEEIVITISQKV